MKIVVNARFLTQKITGVQRFAIELSRELVKIYGDKIKFVAPGNIVQKEIAEEFHVEIVGRKSGYYWEQIELPLYLKKKGSPVLLNFCSVAPLFYKNNIVAVHDITWVRFPNTYSRQFRFVYDIIIPQLCKVARRILTVSKFSLKEISQKYNVPEEKFTIVYNAVDEKFHPVVDHSLSKEDYFISVSSIKENKNFQTVLSSFEKLQSIVKGVKLYIVGDLVDKNFKTIDLKRYKNNSNILFLGRVSDEELIKYYSNAKAFIFPSLYEGFGIPVLEAQACGCPVISSNTSSLPEVLEDSALFCDPMDFCSFADNMHKIMTDSNLFDDLKNKGFRNVNRFSWEASAKTIAKDIDSLMNK